MPASVQDTPEDGNCYQSCIDSFSISMMASLLASFSFLQFIGSSTHRSATCSTTVVTATYFLAAPPTLLNMIRLPPTSISLSESDIHLHLREINIYQSLLQQGFTRDAIQQYYASIRVSDSGGPFSRYNEHRQRPPKASSKQGRRITDSDHQAKFLNTQHNEILASPPNAEPKEAGKTMTEKGEMRERQAFLPSEPAEQDWQRNHFDLSNQPACDDAADEPNWVNAGIVEKNSSADTCPFAPTTVELRARSGVSLKGFPALSHDPSPEHEDLPFQGVEGEAKPREQGIHGDDTNDMHSLTLASNLNLPVRHRPRQSSMLYITHNATSPSSSGQSDDSFKSTVAEMPRASTTELEKSPHTRIKSYRQRSQTYSWVQSEADESKDKLQCIFPGEASSPLLQPSGDFQEAPTKVWQISANKIDSVTTEVRPVSVTRIEPSPSRTTVVTFHRQISSTTPLRAEAEAFVPLKLPPPFSATRRVSSGQQSFPSSIHDTSPSTVHHNIQSRSSPNLALSTPPRSSSIGSIKRHLGSCFTSSEGRELNSSPPVPKEAEQSPDVSPSRRVPTTPVHRGRQTFRETRSRAPPKTPRAQAHMQHMDGPGAVYDDRLPAYLQPRTPADLSRVVHITDREAAYTAPPGRTARTPAIIPQALLSPTHSFEPGEESPSRRAHTLRERRGRELRRSAMMEEAMWERFRVMDVDDVSGRMHWDGPGPGLTNSWRDDFDADRVGEENFDEEGFMRTPRLEPRVQGSARAARQRGP